MGDSRPLFVCLRFELQNISMDSNTSCRAASRVAYGRRRIRSRLRRWKTLPAPALSWQVPRPLPGRRLRSNLPGGGSCWVPDHAVTERSATRGLRTGCPGLSPVRVSRSDVPGGRVKQDRGLRLPAPDGHEERLQGQLRRPAGLHPLPGRRLHSSLLRGDQPTARRENRSMTTARQSQPSWVRMHVMSVTHV